MDVAAGRQRAGLAAPLLRLDGGLVDGSMVSRGICGDATDELVSIALWWTPSSDGTVRQHWQSSEDSGETWTTCSTGRTCRSRTRKLADLMTRIGGGGVDRPLFLMLAAPGRGDARGAGAVAEIAKEVLVADGHVAALPGLRHTSIFRTERLRMDAVHANVEKLETNPDD